MTGFLQAADKRLTIPVPSHVNLIAEDWSSNMRLSLYSVLAVLILFGVVYKVRPTAPNWQTSSPVARATIEGAYRDGLYLGSLQRKQGLPPHAATGRWRRESDRHLFETGYARGYRGSDE